MAISILSWKTAHLHGEAWISQHRLRHKIFVERQRWRVPVYNGLEYDEFDTPSAQYVVWCDCEGQARGVVRLLPTTRPYMLKSLWPELLSPQMPDSPQIWEATRFGCDHTLPASMRREVVAELIAACLEFGLEHGIRSYLALMPVAVFKQVIAAAGCQVEVGRQSLRMGCHDVVAGAVKVDQASLAAVRMRARLHGPMIESAHIAALRPSIGSRPASDRMQ
jgi:acyl homoserine lactone synthase